MSVLWKKSTFILWFTARLMKMKGESNRVIAKVKVMEAKGRLDSWNKLIPLCIWYGYQGGLNNSNLLYNSSRVQDQGVSKLCSFLKLSKNPFWPFSLTYLFHISSYCLPSILFSMSKFPLHRNISHIVWWFTLTTSH